MSKRCSVTKTAKQIDIIEERRATLSNPEGHALPCYVISEHVDGVELDEGDWQWLQEETSPFETTSTVMYPMWLDSYDNYLESYGNAPERILEIMKVAHEQMGLPEMTDMQTDGLLLIEKASKG